MLDVCSTYKGLLFFAHHMTAILWHGKPPLDPTSCDSSGAQISKERYALYTTIHVFYGGEEQQPPVGQDLLIHDISRSHTTTHNSR